MIEETWKELEKKIDCVGNRLFVRTDVLPEKIGSLFLPTKQTEFYGTLKGNDVNVTATVLSAGNECEEELKPGDKILFKRLVFAPCKKMTDNSYCGWVYERDVDLIFLKESVS